MTGLIVRPPTDATLGACRRETDADPLPGNAAIERRKAGDHPRHRPSRRGRGVDRLAEAPDTQTCGLKLVHQTHDVLQRRAEGAQPCHGYDISSLHPVEQTVQLGLVPSSCSRDVLNDVIAAGVLQRSPLLGQVVRIAGFCSDVADQHGTGSVVRAFAARSPIRHLAVFIRQGCAPHWGARSNETPACDGASCHRDLDPARQSLAPVRHRLRQGQGSSERQKWAGS